MQDAVYVVKKKNESKQKIKDLSVQQPKILVE